MCPLQYPGFEEFEEFEEFKVWTVIVKTAFLERSRTCIALARLSPYLTNQIRPGNQGA